MPVGSRVKSHFLLFNSKPKKPKKKQKTKNNKKKTHKLSIGYKLISEKLKKKNLVHTAFRLQFPKVVTDATDQNPIQWEIFQLIELHAD